MWQHFYAFAPAREWENMTLVQQISDFGLNFGILFQLRDDLLDGENIEQAKALLPVYYEKTLKALEGFTPSGITAALHDLTVFCAEREE